MSDNDLGSPSLPFCTDMRPPLRWDIAAVSAERLPASPVPQLPLVGGAPALVACAAASGVERPTGVECDCWPWNRPGPGFACGSGRKGSGGAGHVVMLVCGPAPAPSLSLYSQPLCPALLCATAPAAAARASREAGPLPPVLLPWGPPLPACPPALCGLWRGLDPCQAPRGWLQLWLPVPVRNSRISSKTLLPTAVGTPAPPVRAGRAEALVPSAARGPPRDRGRGQQASSLPLARLASSWGGHSQSCRSPPLSARLCNSLDCWEWRHLCPWGFGPLSPVASQARSQPPTQACGHPWTSFSSMPGQARGAAHNPRGRAHSGLSAAEEEMQCRTPGFSRCLGGVVLGVEQ